MTKHIHNRPGRPDVNAGKAWSEMDIEDLKEHLKADPNIGHAASFLCRSIAETQKKADELGITGFHRAKMKQRLATSGDHQLAGAMRPVKGVLRPDKGSGINYRMSQRRRGQRVKINQEIGVVPTAGRSAHTHQRPKMSRAP